MQLSKEDYFFFEWLILGKGVSQEAFSKMSDVEMAALRNEWKAWFDKQEG